MTLRERWEEYRKGVLIKGGRTALTYESWLEREVAALTKRLERVTVCGTCKGTGEVRERGLTFETDSPDEILDSYRAEKCPVCGGKGVLVPKEGE